MERYCRTKFAELGMTQSCIHAHILAVRYLASFMEREGFADYTSEVGEKYDVFSEEVKEAFSPQHTRYAHRIVRRLNESFNNVYISHPLYRPRRFTMQGEIGNQGKKYLEYRQIHDKVSFKTIRKAEICIGHFSMFCNEHAVTLETMSREFLLQYVDIRRKTCYTGLNIIGAFLKYLFDQKLISHDYSGLFRNQKPVCSQKIVHYYTDVEIRQIEESVDRSTKIGKQKYALVLLGSRLGLRASDIAGLKGENFDWDKCLITLIQYKTKKKITLPLTEDVGMALIDYISNARPKVKWREIFITSQQPYRPLIPGNVGNLIRSVIKSSRIAIKGRHIGPHALRHSLATTMINKGTGLSVISGSLGHSATQSTLSYVAVNVTSLLECSLEVPVVNPDFYIQKGGIFYE